MGSDSIIHLAEDDSDDERQQPLPKKYHGNDLENKESGKPIIKKDSARTESNAAALVYQPRTSPSFVQNASTSDDESVATILRPATNSRETSDQAQVSPPNHFSDFADIVQSIDRKSAIRRTRYDPRTVARDILISTSQNPATRGLKLHLDSLKTNFKEVHESSDPRPFVGRL